MTSGKVQFKHVQAAIISLLFQTYPLRRSSPNGCLTINGGFNERRGS